MMSILRRLSLWLALAGMVVVAPIPSTRATINSAVNKTIALGTGAQTQFSFNFVGVASAYISVIFTDANGVETTLTQGSGTTQYQIALNAPLQGALWGIGGTVTYNPNGSPIANGTTLTIFRTLPLTQAISLQNQISLTALGKGSETGLDTLEMQIQQASEDFSRAITAPIVDPPGINLILPPAAQRANTGIAFDSQGNVIAGTTPATGLISSAMQPVVDASSLVNGRIAFGLGTGAAPHFTRLSNVNTTFTPDANATLMEIQIVGGGGGGSGNGARNAIGYNQYGGVGGPSGVGAKSSVITISQGSPAVVTWPNHGLQCNDPINLTTTGTLPSPLVATTYYVMCDFTITTNTFEISSIQFDVPLTCAVYAPRCQTAINTTTPGSGIHTGQGFAYVAFGGYGGGIVGDQANPGGYRGCDDPGPAGYVQSYGITGTQGENSYIYPGYSIDGGRGGGTPFGGGASGGVAGIIYTGGGGDGARPTVVSAGGGSGGGAGYCRIWLKPAGSIPVTCGGGGSGGVAQLDPVTISIASPAVVTFNNHGFFGGVNPPTTCSVIQFTTTGALPTGISPNTNYFVLNTGLTANTFEIAADACGGTAVNTSGSQSGTQSVTSGVAGGAGGSGACYITQYFQ